MKKYNKHFNDRSNYPTRKKLDRKYSEDRDETLGEMLIRRNYLLLDFFSRIQKESVELYGKAESPMIVLGRKIKLSVFVKNFKLHFTNSPHIGSDVIFSVTISPTAKLSSFAIEDFIQDYKQEEWGDVVSRLLGKKTKLEEEWRAKNY